MQILVLNGPINAGKTTTGRALAALLPDALFIDGDDHEAADDAPLEQRIEASFAHIEQLIATTLAGFIVVAVPLRDVDYRRLLVAGAARGAVLRVVTLAPPPAIAFSNRGNRPLSSGEVERARQMHEEGYADRPFSDLIVTDMAGAQATAAEIARSFKLPLAARQPSTGVFPLDPQAQAAT
ncbi:shikimate kinase [Devosia beringensis]|uniref:shikimate kinase n=1 Tax=Devosia beringensis TaxID=2657486 RepID=UPI00186BA1A8|nr:shikimate kinase [Devosia beringensis]